LEDLGVDGTIIFELILSEDDGRKGVKWNNLAGAAHNWRAFASSCKGI